MVVSSRAIVLATALAGIAAVAVVAWRAVVSPPTAILREAPPVSQAPAGIATLSSLTGPPPAVSVRPSFDVVRVEPSGETVVAGRSAAGAHVVLLDGDHPLAEVVADANGQFALVPPPLGPGDHVLTLRTNGGSPNSADATSTQNVAVSVPERGQGRPLVAIAEPDQPTRVLSAPGPGEASQVAIRTAEAGEDGAFCASGIAPAGGQVRLYLNEAFVAEVTATPEGRWSLNVGRGLTPGHYDVRADMVEAGGKVAARAQVPFDFPEQTATRTLASAAGAPSQAAPGLALVQEVQSVTVGRGDSLWRISRKVFGAGRRYTQIYEANAGQISDPNRIWPGQVLVTPQTAVP